MPGSGSAPTGTSSGSLAGHEATGHIDKTWFGAAMPTPRLLSIASRAALTLVISAPSSERRVTPSIKPSSCSWVSSRGYGPDLLDIGVTNQDHVLFVQEVEFALGGARGTDVDALLALRRCDKFSLNLCLCGLMPRFRG
jgi:hypothetical protein